MRRFQHMLVYSSRPPRLENIDQRQYLHQYVIVFIIAIIIPTSAIANLSCKSRFVNPISDICWSCLLPVSIGPLRVGGGKSPTKRDTKNPKSPLCACRRGGQPIPIPGITLGFWEPARMTDITRSKYCMVGLGIDMGGKDATDNGTYNRSHSAKKTSHDSFYHLHYYIYPLIYWLELITDLICLEKTSFDVAYLSELDPMWNDEKIQTLLNPEAFLFGNPAAQAACVLDCVAASFDFPRDELFWCSGCWGNIYPFSGANADHVGGVQNSSLLTARILGKMHRAGLAKNTSTNDHTTNGKICKKQTALRIKKSQYKLQMVYPKPTKGAVGCWPIGLSDMAYSSSKEYPWDGQDWSYVIWRKRNCCAF